MNTTKQKADRLPALALAAALTMPAFAAAGFQPPEQPSPSFRFTTNGLVLDGEPNAQILIRGPMRPRVVMGHVGRGYLGVQLMDLTEELREFYGATEDAGTLVSRVSEDSPAAAAGFEVGDVITRVGGELAENSRDVVRSVAQFDPEEQVEVEVIRDGAPVTLTATLGEREGGVWFSRGGGPDLEEFHFEMPDLEGLEVLRELPETITEDTREAVREAIEAARERMSEFDYEALQERLAATEERLRELEQKLAERER
ncbi:MAG: PDZ domain-containing protein [Acidobacteria bacterium]|nr:PDZ domain-containing protein [Acidobacteriota bacterium]